MDLSSPSSSQHFYFMPFPFFKNQFSSYTQFSMVYTILSIYQSYLHAPVPTTKPPCLTECQLQWSLWEENNWESSSFAVRSPQLYITGKEDFPLSCQLWPREERIQNKETDKFPQKRIWLKLTGMKYSVNKSNKQTRILLQRIEFLLIKCLLSVMDMITLLDSFLSRATWP